MRHQKIILLLGLVVGILMLSIVYALINGIQFNISGTATAVPDQANFKVRLTGASVDESLATATITGDTTAIINVTGLKAVGDSVTATFTIINESADLIANLSAETTSNNANYLKITNTFTNANLVAGSSTQLLVEVKVVSLPTSEIISIPIGVGITAAPAESVGNTIVF